MDVKCRKCGEPWDLDTFHEVAEESGESFDKAYARFRKDGCFATGWLSKPCEGNAHPGIGEIMDLLGDDVDGAASLLEDFGGWL